MTPIQERRISVFDGPIQNVIPRGTVTLGKFFDAIRSRRWEKRLEAIRAEPDKDRRQILKNKLPYVSPAGIFSQRANACIETLSGVIAIDLDGFDSAEEAKQARDTIAEDDYVLAAFLSASGRGVVAFVSIDSRRHKDSYDAISDYLGNRYNVTANRDNQAKAVSQARYVSSDPDIHINWNAKTFTLPPAEPKQSRIHTNGRTSEDDVREVLSCLKGERYDYLDWLRISSGVLQALGGDIHAAESLLQEYLPEERDGEYLEKLNNPLTEISFATTVWYAQQRGYKARGPVPRVGNGTGEAQALGKNYPTGDFPLTDLGNAERFASDHAQKVRYVHPWNAWLIWDGRRWQRDESGQAMQLAYGTVRKMQKEAVNISDDSRRQAVLKWGIASQNASRLRAMVELARNLEGIPVAPGELDVDEWLITVENGTLDLRTGQLRPHRQTDLITKLAPVTFDKSATCERWEQFVLEIFAGSADLAGYLQRLAGYGLTGSVREQMLAVLYGLGANGKGTLLETLQSLLGDYAQSMRPDVLMTRRRSGGPSEGEAGLHGARFVTTSETGSQQKFDEALVKRLTGGDTIRARYLHSNEFQFKPTHKIFLATNHKPVIEGTDHAIWRRIHLIPFNVRFEGKNEDADLKEKLIAESSGILNWLIHGCLEWQRNGLGAPVAVLSATEAYRAEMDLLAGFIEECCNEIEGLQGAATALYQAYRSWCERNGEHALTQMKFGLQLSERGFTKEKSGRVFYKGIGLKPEQDEDDRANEAIPDTSTPESDDDLPF